MSDDQLSRELRILHFEKVVNGETLKCTVEELKDGSVYVACDEFEMGVEFTDDALEKAIGHVTDAGYQQVSE